MIEAGLEFVSDAARVVTAFVTLPREQRPIQFSHGEKPRSSADRIDDQKKFSAFLAKSQSGFFLLGEGLTYSVRIAAGKPTVCDCFLDVEPRIAQEFLAHMATAQPVFGYACDPEEREYRNRVTAEHGVNTIESWVGRDIDKYLPGFYWLTFLTDALASKHAIRLAAVEAVAREHITLASGQHLFRFYDRPQDWRTSSASAELCALFPGVFDVERVKRLLGGPKNFLELDSLLRAWK